MTVRPAVTGRGHIRSIRQSLLFERPAYSLDGVEYIQKSTGTIRGKTMTIDFGKPSIYFWSWNLQWIAAFDEWLVNYPEYLTKLTSSTMIVVIVDGCIGHSIEFRKQ
jgi:hypothetical protein